MAKAWIPALLAVLALALAGGASPGTTAVAAQEFAIPMDDGVKIAATLYEPAGSPPAGGWPALVFLHGLAGNRQSMNALVSAYGFVGAGYVVLTFDARGHGESGGLVTIDGPREIADVRAIHAWLAARPDVADARIGAWGISYGGGAALNSLAAGVPWAAVATVETWTNLYKALVPQGLVKSGLVAGLAASIPEARRDPSLAAVQAAAFSGQVSSVVSWAAQRSSLAKLGSVSTPVFMAQGRRDFLFGIDQGLEALKRLHGPRFLYVGLHGHAPSTFPAADTGLLMSRTRAWFDLYLRGSGVTTPMRVALAPERFVGKVIEFRSIPRTSPSRFQLPGSSQLWRGGKVVRRTPRLAKALETFGTPTVKVGITPRGGWSRLVAVLSARTPDGNEVVVATGGVPTGPGTRSVTIDLSSQATFVPRGSRFTLTFGSSSLAQSTSNLVYLDLPMPQRANVRIGAATLRIPALRQPVTK